MNERLSVPYSVLSYRKQQIATRESWNWYLLFITISLYFELKPTFFSEPPPTH